MIKYLSSRFAFPRLHDSDTSVDGFLSDYVTVVNLARDLLEAELTKGVNEKPIFIFDGNLVAGLFLVAVQQQRRLGLAH